MSRVGRRELLAAVPGALAVDEAEAAVSEPRALLLKDTGAFPNSHLPALVYASALALGPDLADRLEALFARHGWTGAWQNGLYRTHHYHSTAHEVLGVYRGNVSVRLGGPAGPIVDLRAGDVAIIPAGVAHKNEQQSPDFAVLGAYPTGTGPDMQYGKPDERPATDRSIAAVALPSADPVTGAQGSLLRRWRATH
jgi:uncharacterized protein YjlB